MDIVKVFVSLNRLVLKIFPVLFGMFVVLFTIIILASGLQAWEMVKFLAISYLGFALIYGVYRFLRFVFSE